MISPPVLRRVGNVGRWSKCNDSDAAAKSDAAGNFRTYQINTDYKGSNLFEFFNFFF